MRYCQGTQCHEYRTKDRIRGHKGDKHYETRKRSHFYYNGNFCSLGCQDDWFRIFGTRAIDHFGRIHEPIKCTIDNAWVKDRDYNTTTNEFDIYLFRNKITNERRPLTAQQYNNPDLVRP